MINKELADALQELHELMKEKKIKIVLAESQDRTPDEVVRKRIEKMNNGLVIIDYPDLTTKI